MLFQKVICPFILSTLLTFCFIGAAAQDVTINVEPTISRAINGHLELERAKYFNLSHGGVNFESTINDKQRSDHYLLDLQMSFGRSLGMVGSAVKWGGNVREDPLRSGRVDLDYLRSKSAPDDGSPSETMKDLFPNNLGVANHDRHNAYPDWMPQVTTSQAGDDGNLPTNVDAAGELAVALLKYDYTDWTRPATYEAINEPHWSIDAQLLANLHLAIWQKAKDENLSTLIGGPCMSVGYFYKNNYQYFSTLSKFIDNTQCKLDFYSFHVYDYLKWDASRNDFFGRVSTGLPMEGVLDLIPNYTINKYGKPVELVFSEHGGYISNDLEGALDFISNKYFPGSGFAWEMKRRSISDFIMVSSAIANTMAFMNHPDVVKKGVPFILLESFSWNPKYYYSLLVADNFTDKSHWVESKLIYFYEFFKGVNGHRVQSECANPDIQQQAFVDGHKLFLVMNNLSDKVENLKINFPSEGIQSIQIRRVGRNEDFTPYLTEESALSLDGLQLKGRESMLITISYQDDIQETQQTNEEPFYGTEVTKQFSGTSTFTVNIPDLNNAKYAYLRVGIGRPAGTDRKVEISLNGTALQVPDEDCATYLENESEFATTKIIRVDKSLLKTSNSISVTFPDGKMGGVGAVVLRVAYQSTGLASMDLPMNSTEIKVYPNPSSGSDIYIEFPEKVNNVRISLYSCNGVLIARKDVPNSQYVEMDTGENTKKGVYLLKVQSDQIQSCKKIILN